MEGISIALGLIVIPLVAVSTRSESIAGNFASVGGNRPGIEPLRQSAHDAVGLERFAKDVLLKLAIEVACLYSKGGRHTLFSMTSESSLFPTANFRNPPG